MLKAVLVSILLCPSLGIQRITPELDVKSLLLQVEQETLDMVFQQGVKELIFRFSQALFFDAFETEDAQLTYHFRASIRDLIRNVRRSISTRGLVIGVSNYEGLLVLANIEIRLILLKCASMKAAPFQMFVSFYASDSLLMFLLEFFLKDLALKPRRHWDMKTVQGFCDRYRRDSGSLRLLAIQILEMKTTGRMHLRSDRIGEGLRRISSYFRSFQYMMGISDPKDDINLVVQQIKAVRDEAHRRISEFSGIAPIVRRQQVIELFI